MVILPEGMFEGVTDPIESPFLLCAHQERDVALVLAPRAGWYNHYGQVLSQGDLALNDFINIMNALNQLEDAHGSPAAPFIVVPSPKTEAPLYHTISQHELAQQCSFVITARGVHAFDLLTPTLFNFFQKNGVKLIVGHRNNLYSVLGVYLIH
ncbi:MAG TPA: hypothetical protein DIU47_01450 [Candidatus Pacebacteria bacterium]|nr:hypothetical protein [Candidatus Paceibacterota bacterium]